MGASKGKGEKVEVIHKDGKHYVWSCPMHGGFAVKGSITRTPDDAGYSPEMDIYYCPKCFAQATLREVFINAKEVNTVR